MYARNTRCATEPFPVTIAIGKRQNMLRKRTWDQNFYRETAQFDKEIRAGLVYEWQTFEDLQDLVRSLLPLSLCGR